MSMRDEIRAALTAHGPQSVNELLARCPSVGGARQVLLTNLYVLKSEGKVRRAGLSDDGEPLYALDRWPMRETPATGESAPAATPAKADKAGPKVQRGAAKVAAVRAKKTTAPAPAQKTAPAKSQRPAAKTPRKAGEKTPAQHGRPPGAAIVAFENGYLATAAVPRPLLATLWHSDTGTPDPTIVSRTRSGDIVLTRQSDGAYSIVPAVVAREIAALVA